MSSQTHYDVTITWLTRNAGAILDRALDAVATQETERSVALLVLDSGSTDGTIECLEKHGARIIAIEPETFDFGTARDRAFEETASPIVVNLSQDAVPAHTRWLENLLAPLDDKGVAASCGRSVPDPERPERQFPWERNGYFYFTAEMRKFRERYGQGFSNANSAIKRAVWEKLRFGPQPIGEDFKFQTKLHAAGYRIAFPDDAPVLHHHDYGMGSLWTRCRNEGLGLRELDCPYTELDLLMDLLSPKKYAVWARDLLHGRLTTPASLLFPVLRPCAVYAGSRFGRRCRR
ncbi:MAG: glycosyltransferase [Candidatus Hydrogenedentes bacterium]|nr:glycosyltransferase [Candidatus Hydrogenedentota bacterium]